MHYHSTIQILDEPTVGVDPLLRAAIWTHLENLCNKDGLTVIITTHYIEEARSAETIGLMRYGQLLVQSNPETLLAHHNLPRLEDVFLKLCMIQDNEIAEEICISTEDKLVEISPINVIEESTDLNNNNNNNNNIKDDFKISGIFF